MPGDTVRIEQHQRVRARGLGVLLFAASPWAHACPACVPLVEAGIFGENFLRHLLLMVLPIAVLLLIALAVYRSGSRSTEGEDE